MGRKPLNEKPMSAAERQRRLRERRAELTPLQRLLLVAGLEKEGPLTYTPEELEKINRIRMLLGEVEKLAAAVNASLVVRADGCVLDPELQKVAQQLREGFTRINLPIH